ncbi:hypothetical protein [Ruminococcus sp.]|uniref:hypothetical protein n=1 Tax=Ruminococcus sp. TaxID=41978 RepID=UPI0025CFC2B2|nr:hypothetical protein [Ruminococcus sp.]MBQ8965752.1 hypothetical protein [Ruminococcus sp.]
MGSEDFNWLGFVVKYTLGRLGLLLALVVFGAFTGAVLFPAVITFLPYSLIAVKNFFGDAQVQSVIGMLVVCLFLIWVFWDDAKRHSAYEEWSLTTILTVLNLVGLFYFIPAIFRESFNSEGKGDVLYMVLYYPAKWVIDVFGGNYIVGVIGSIVVLLGTALGAYVISYKRYMKKHPVLLTGGRRTLAAAAAEYESEEGEDDN